MKIRSVGAELFHEEGQTEGRTEKRNEANSRFTEFFEQA
jgi:hypothetical protein